MKLTYEMIAEAIEQELMEFAKSSSDSTMASGNIGGQTQTTLQPTQQENSGGDDPKKLLRQNATKHVQMLRFMRETLKGLKASPELQNMANEIKKSDTSTFIEQVLNVKPSIPINTKTAIEDPIAMIGSILDELIKQSVNGAHQKLNLKEEEIPNLENK